MKSLTLLTYASALIAGLSTSYVAFHILNLFKRAGTR